MPRIDGADHAANRSENPLSKPASAEAPAPTPTEVLRSIRTRLWSEFYKARTARDACPDRDGDVLCFCELAVVEASATYLSFARHPFLHES